MSAPLTIALALALLATGCAFDAHRQGERCETDEQCGADGLCVDGLCVARPPDALVSPALDAGRVDSAPPDDLGPALDQAIERDQAPVTDLAPVDQAPPPDAAPPPDQAVPLTPPLTDLPLLGICPADHRCYAADDDTYIDADTPNGSFHAAPTLEISQGHRGGDPKRALIRFDLSRFVDHQWPAACDLRLRRTRDPRGRLRVALLMDRVETTPLEGWTSAITNNRPPNTAGGRLPDRFGEDLDDDEPLAVDVTDRLRDARSEGSPGLGLSLKFDPDGSAEEVAFHSLEAERQLDDPTLIGPFLDCRFTVNP